MVIIGIVFMKATPTSSKSMFYQACSAGSSIVKTQISVWKRDIGLMFGNPGKTTGKSNIHTWLRNFHMHIILGILQVSTHFLISPQVTCSVMLRARHSSVSN